MRLNEFKILISVTSILENTSIILGQMNIKQLLVGGDYQRATHSALLSKKKTAFLGGLHLFGLLIFVLSQPILDILSKNQEFFVLHGSRTGEILSFALFVGIVLPACVALAVSSIIVLGRKVHQIVHIFFISVLLALFLMPHLKAIDPLSGIGVLLLSWFLGLIGALLYHRFKAVKTFFTCLAPAALIFPALFIFQSQIVFPGAKGTGMFKSSGQGPADAPVFLIVFDEFSTEALLDKTLNIDKENFPNIAKFAGDSYWFRNATTVAESTTLSVPAILTGLYPESQGSLPTYNYHPVSIFTILANAGYAVYAFERNTQLCPDSINQYVSEKNSFVMRLVFIFSDTLVLAGHIFLKEDLTDWLPSIEGRWAGFTKKETPKPRLHALVQFQNFFNSIDGSKRRLYVAHINLPHVPYQFLPSGKRYTMSFDMPGWVGRKKKWDVEGVFALQAQQRYLLQARFVDSLFGRFVDRLKDSKLYDDALIVITADHGVSYRPGFNRRKSIEMNHDTFGDIDVALDILKVPTFIKLPHQTRGGVIDEEFQTIDILPTVISSLNIADASEFDGRAMLNSEVQNLPAYRVLSTLNKTYLEHNLNILSPQYDIDRKFRVFDPTNCFSIRLKWYETLVGRHISDVSVYEDPSVRVELEDPGRYQSVDLSADFLPAMIKGTILTDGFSERPLDLSIAVNGRIEAVSQTFLTETGSNGFSVLVREEAFREGWNKIEVFVITRGEGREPRLARLGVPTATYAGLIIDRKKRVMRSAEQGKSFPILKGLLRGRITAAEQVTSSQYLVSGWAANLEKGEPAERVVLFMKDRPVLGSRINRSTRWLPRKHKKPGLANCGFEFILRKDSLRGLKSLEDLSFYAISRDPAATKLGLGKLGLIMMEEIFPGLPRRASR